MMTTTCAHALLDSALAFPLYMCLCMCDFHQWRGDCLTFLRVDFPCNPFARTRVHMRVNVAGGPNLY